MEQKQQRTFQSFSMPTSYRETIKKSLLDRKKKMRANFLMNKNMERSNQISYYAPHTILIRNLPHNFSKEEMEKILLDHFGKFGDIKYITAIPQNQSRIKGNAYLTFSNGEQSKNAVLGSKNFKINQRLIICRDFDSNIDNAPSIKEQNENPMIISATYAILEYIEKKTKDLTESKKRIDPNLLHKVTHLNYFGANRKCIKVIWKGYKSMQHYLDSHPFNKIFIYGGINKQKMRGKANETPEWIAINSNVSKQEIHNLLQSMRK